MPGVTLHFVLAREVLARWRAETVAPFDIDDPGHLNAFYHGSLGPDLGYFPGGDRVLSQLSHCVRTGALTRTLIQTARTPIERAFAWGWLTHVLGDREIHPLVGRAVGEFTRGSSGVFVDGATDPLTHLRIEIGLDCWYAYSFPEASAIRLRPAFDEAGIGFLERAYARTYGVAIPRTSFLGSHRVSGRRAGQSLATLRIIGGLMEGHECSLTLPGARSLLRAAYRSSALRGVSLAYLNPVRPAAWLIDGVTHAIPRYVESFMAEYESEAAGLDDWNLDTGRLLATEVDHPGTLQALESLARLMEASLEGSGPRRVRPTAEVGGERHRTV